MTKPLHRATVPAAHSDDFIINHPSFAGTLSAARQQLSPGAPLSKLRQVLFLCRTPLQARICLKIIEVETLATSDVLYFTHDDNESDRLYFSRLRERARHAQYLHVPPQRHSILGDLKAYVFAERHFTRSTYDAVFLASIGSIFFRSILKRHPKAVLHTFDDGTSNIIENWYISYHQDKPSGRLRIYNALAGVISQREIKEKSVKHYSIYSDFKNICPPEKLAYLEIFPLETEMHSTGLGASFFIGQPFYEYLSPEKIARLRHFIESQKIDFYVAHPRETQAITSSIPLLKKNGELAEIAIMQASQKAKPNIFASFSTVLFNIPNDRANKYYLHFGGDDSGKEMLALVQKAGCKVVKI